MAASQRTKAGLERAPAKGKVLGRPKFSHGDRDELIAALETGDRWLPRAGGRGSHKARCRSTPERSGTNRIELSPRRGPQISVMDESRPLAPNVSAQWLFAVADPRAHFLLTLWPGIPIAGPFLLWEKHTSHQDRVSLAGVARHMGAANQ